MDELPPLSLNKSHAQLNQGGKSHDIQPFDLQGVPFNRSLAYIIDFIILAVISSVIVLAATILTLMSFFLLLPITTIVFSLLPLLPLAYHSYFLSQKGATPGMNAMDVKIITMNGTRPSLIQAAIATIIFYLTVPVTSMLILLVMLFNTERRTLHDLFTNTIIVNEDGL